MKQILSVLIIIAVLVSLGVGGTLAYWVDSDSGDYDFEADEWQVDLEGTIGLWLNWENHTWENHTDIYYEGDINYWLNSLNNPTSTWLMPDVDEDGDIDVTDMVLLIEQKDESRKAMFLAQYLAQRLNQMSGRQSEFTLHNVMDVPSYAESGNYLGLLYEYDATGWEIVQQIEAKYGAPELQDPDADEFEIMKDVCDWLNNMGIY